MNELTTEELRRVQLELLDEVDRFCRGHDLTYYLAWGTLLGAVRHGGYIPWDDDIDLMMFRSDYDVFANTFPHENRSDQSVVASPQTTSDWPYPYLKVADQRTRWIESSDLAVPLGVNIDIFPIDGFATGSIRRWLHEWEIRLLRGLLLLQAVTRRSDRAVTKRLFLGASKVVLRRVKTSRLTDWLTRSARRYEAKTGRSVGVRVGPSDWAVDYHAIKDPREILFEHRVCLGPADAHAVLSATYGDYMKLPPVGKRLTHHGFSAYWLR